MQHRFRLPRGHDLLRCRRRISHRLIARFVDKIGNLLRERLPVDLFRRHDGAAVGSPSYVQCRISLKALRQGVSVSQQKAAQDNARAGELKAQSEQQQLQAAAQQAAAERAAAVQTDILDAMERRQDDANNAAILQGVLDGLNRNKPKLRCRTTGTETNCF